MINTPLISIIVPFYNIEDSAKYCIASLMRQSVDNYELILVNDGSTDRTPEILDSYSTNDKVRVFHKNNGGVSDARNFGLRHTSAPFVSFVDGDDIVSPYYVEALSRYTKLPGKPFVASPQLVMSYKNAVQESYRWGTPVLGKQIHKQEFLNMLLYNAITESLWGKLIPRSVYGIDPFPVGRVYEDLSTIVSFISACDSFYVLDKPIYGYVQQQQNSIVRVRNAKLRQLEDYLVALDEFVEQYEAQGKHSQGLVYRKCLAYARMHALAKRVIDNPNRAAQLDKEGREFIRKSLKTIWRDRSVGVQHKVRLTLLALTPSVHDLILNLFKSLRM